MDRIDTITDVQETITASHSMAVARHLTQLLLLTGKSTTLDKTVYLFVNSVHAILNPLAILLAGVNTL